MRLAGAVVVGCWFLLSNLVFRRRLVRSARPLAGVDCPLPVYVSAGAPSPCLSGLVRPGIYLTPDCPAEGPGLKRILAHELTHRRQGDQFWALIRCLCLALYWFNPLVWLAAALSRRDCELSCDEGAIRLLGEGERTAYGRTLLSLVTTGSNPTELLRTATTMSSGARGLRERIALIARKPKWAAGVLVIALVIVAVAVGCTFTGAQPVETPEPSPTGENPSPSPSPTEETEPDNSTVLVDDFSYTGIHRDVTYYPDAPTGQPETGVAYTYRMGDEYLADRGGSRETGTRPAASTAIVQALDEILAEGNTVVLTLERHTGGETTRKTVVARPEYGITSGWLDWLDWSYVDAPAEEPECDAAIYLSTASEPADAVSRPAIGDDGDYMKFYQDSGLVRWHTGGRDIWYYAQSDGQEYHDTGNTIRNWYDSSEYEAALSFAVTPEMLEEAREKYDIPPVDDDPAHQDFALVAWVWSEQLAENLRNLEPDSQYAVLDAQVYSADLPSSDDYYAPEPGVGDSFVFGQVLALQVPNLYTAPYQAGSGLWEIEDGPYAGWYGWGLFRGMEKQGDNWVSNGGFTG